MNPGSRRALTATLKSMAVSPASASVSAARALSTAVPIGSSSRRTSNVANKGTAPVISGGAVSSSRKATQFLPVINDARWLGSARLSLGAKGGFGSRSNGVKPPKLDSRQLGIRCEATVAEPAEQAPPPEAPGLEKHEYQAEVSRLLNIIVHSLYSHKEVFLRELVSNASDALDKLRFLSVTDPDLLSADGSLEIRIFADSNAGTITLTDTGLGMTHDELVKSLGTIAESGTAKFLKALKDKEEGGMAGDSNLIGQFGVGFYSAFLVSHKVEVSTKSPKSDKQYVWESEADSSSFIIREETDPEKLLPRGTSVTLYLKPEDKYEYTDLTRLQTLVKQYSQFISFPIYLWNEKTKSTEVEDDTPPKEGEIVDPHQPKKTKTVNEKYWDWDMVNDTKPIWMRANKEVSEEEYKEFFKNTFKEYIDPLAYSHFSTEGEIEFKSLLYIPGMAPISQDETWSDKNKNLRLYVKRVFISDQYNGELLPKYLGFVKGVVDSNDLPLNVSRELLQESRVVRIMKKRLVKKTLDMIEEISKRDSKDYFKFWFQFGKYIKVGLVEDSSNHKKLAPFLRFYSSKNEEFMTSLDSYVENMKPDQKAIYYFAADNVKSAKTAPFLEELLKKDYEVLFLIEPVDEVAVTNLKNYKDVEFVDISKEDFDLGDPASREEVEKEYRLLTDSMKSHLGDRIAKVIVSKRENSIPCVLVSGKHGWSANMERIMRAQAFGDMSHLEYMRQSRVLEINPNHPIIRDLNEQLKESPRNPKTLRGIELLYETAQLSSGFTPENPTGFSAKVWDVMALALTGKSLDEYHSERGYNPHTDTTYGGPYGQGVYAQAQKAYDENQYDALYGENDPYQAAYNQQLDAAYDEEPNSFPEMPEAEPESAPVIPEVVEPSEVRAEGDPWKS